MTVRVTGTGVTGELVATVFHGDTEPRAIIAPADGGKEIDVEVTAVEVVPLSDFADVDAEVLDDACRHWDAVRIQRRRRELACPDCRSMDVTCVDGWAFCRCGNRRRIQP